MDTYKLGGSDAETDGFRPSATGVTGIMSTDKERKGQVHRRRW